jgi:maltose O-acetyltransferase
VTIGDRVWLGVGAIVLPGVTIADDVVVGAGAVVTRDCPVPGLYAGVPAVRVR